MRSSKFGLANLMAVAAIAGIAAVPGPVHNSGRQRSIKRSDEALRRGTGGTRRLYSGDPLAAERAAHNAAVEEKKREKLRRKLEIARSDKRKAHV